jgi:hypothetical protein
MSIGCVRDIADAVLYEGYILYPYRPSAIKNQQRWTAGGVFPCDYGEAGGETSMMRTEVIICGNANAKVDVTIRCLQTQSRQVAKLVAGATNLANEPIYDPVAMLDVDGQQFVSWDEAIERELIVPGIPLIDVISAPIRKGFEFPAHKSVETVYSKDGKIAGAVTRTNERIDGAIEIAAEAVSDATFRLSIAITNTTPLSDSARISRADAQRYAFMSTHMILSLRGGEFVSLLDPPEHLRKATEACNNQGTWPVLAGAEGARDTMLSSPIILYDYPRVAPESNCAFFDGAEIDELLTLRVLTLTDEEKREMAAADPRTRGILARCEALTRTEHGNLHGVFRVPQGERTPPNSTCRTAQDGENDLSVGHHVRLKPKTRGDVLDIALKGKAAVVESIERDFEGRTYLAVTLLDDPGGDFGASGFPGHRFYFSLDEVEPIEREDF